MELRASINARFLRDTRSRTTLPSPIKWAHTGTIHTTWANIPTDFGAKHPQFLQDLKPTNVFRYNRGPFIIHDPKPPFHFDEELTLTFSDWYHEQMPDLIYNYQSYSGEAADGTPTPTGGSLINSGKNVSIPVKPNKTYYVHIICPSSYQGIAWIFDGHPMTVVEVDGIYVDPVSVGYLGNMTRIAPGQRWGVLIQTKNDTSKNYAIWDSMDVNMLFINKGIIPPPKDYNTNATAWLVYDENAPLPDPPVFSQEDLTNTYVSPLRLIELKDRCADIRN